MDFEMINEALFTSKTEEWATPQAFFDELNKEFSFTLDPCATPENAKCAKYFTKETDTAYFHDYIYHNAEIRFIRGRLHFNASRSGAPFPSMVAVMRGKEQCSTSET